MLTPEELEIARRAKELGKTPDEALAGIAKYRESKSKITPTEEPTKKPFANKITEFLGLGGATKTFGDVLARQGIGTETPKEVTQQFIEKPTAGQVAGALGQVGATVGGLAFGGPATLAGKAALGAGLGYAYDVGQNLIEKKGVAETLTPGASTIIGAGLPVAFKGAEKVIGALSKPAQKAISELPNSETIQGLKKGITNTIDDFGSRISSPTVTGATRVSLNPKEALKGTGQDMTVSIGGKLKKLSEVTPSENTKMQFSTEKSINKFTEQAKKFKNNRNPVNDPTEIVGKRVDAALNFADKKRQVVGRKMGEIELKYANEQLPIGNKTIDSVSTLLKDMEQPKFGVDSADAPIVKKLTADMLELENNGAPIADRMEFIRSWDKYLNDAKDPFGNFKENATVNTRIQNTVKALKNETVDAISAKDKVYRGLRTQYSVYKKLDETGNRLLGKEGLLGDRIKGGATVKRAIKSNSDAGARQFLTQLKELTGYDAIKDGDLALTAMENVGDYHGLSLLEVLKEGKTGIVGKGLEKIQKTLVGDEAARVSKFIKKGTETSKLLSKKKK